MPEIKPVRREAAPTLSLAALLTLFISTAAAFAQTPPGDCPAIATFPRDVRHLNVCALGADPTGRTDCTRALQAAIDSVQDLQFGQRWLYFPAGTYLISDELVARRFITFQGENRETTTIRLVDRAPGYGDAGTGKNMLKVGVTVNESFEVFVNDLTFDAGEGNPGAVALDFQAHNIGAVRDVAFVAPEGSGKVGLQLQRNKSERDDWSTPGPMLIQRVEVSGFDVGILTGESTAGLTHVTLESIRVSGQRTAGIDVQPRLNLSLRNLESVNAVPAIRFKERSFGSTLSLAGATLTGGAPGASAIVIDTTSRVYLRDVETAGYRSAVAHGGAVVPGTSLPEWSSTRAMTLFAAGECAPAERLPVRETPTYDNDAFATDWQNVPDGDLQAALDAGKPVVYLQDKGRPEFNVFPVRNTITIPPSVRLLHFMGQAVTFANWEGGPEAPVFVVEGTSEDPPLIVERMYYQDQLNVATNPMWLHRGSRTVVFKDSRGRYRAEAGAGDVFFEDYVSEEVDLAPGQRAWGRQLNLEDARNLPGPLITNDGADLWILGYKTEGAKVGIRTVNGGTTEMHGGNFIPLQGAPTTDIPLFEIEDAAFVGTGYQAFYTWPIHVRETRGGVTREFRIRGKVNMALFTAGTCATTGTASPEHPSRPGAALLAYPNPARDHVRLRLPHVPTDSVRIRVREYVTGRVVAETSSKGRRDVYLALPSLPPGVYLAEVAGGGGSWRTPVVIE